MESVQKKHRVLVSTYDMSNMVHEESHEIDAQLENAVNRKMLPGVQ
jgi:hypothetical protein